jgi:uroporphyrinogen-III synthase
MPKTELNGLTILVTRPAHQAEPLCRLIESAGGQPLRLPALTIHDNSADPALCRRLGRDPDLVPQGSFDSESLLALEPLQHVSGKRIVIFRGNGGRELLADTLRQRGARVDYAEVYRRGPPPPPADTEWLQKTDIITLTSSEALHNLVTMTPATARDALYDKPLVVISERSAQLARQLGFRQSVLLTPRACDEAIIATLMQWAAMPHNKNGR